MILDNYKKCERAMEKWDSDSIIETFFYLVDNVVKEKLK